MEHKSHKSFAKLPFEDNAHQPVNETAFTQPDLRHELNPQIGHSLVIMLPVEYSNEIIDKKIMHCIRRMGI